MHPIRDILIEAGYQLTDTGLYWRTSAAFRGGKNRTTLSIDKKTGYFTDFATGQGGTAEQLAAIICGKEIKFNSANFEAVPSRDKLSVTKYYPKEILKRLVPDYDLFLERGISKETLETFEAGLAMSGQLKNRICFPIYERTGRIVGFSGRYFKQKPYYDTIPKWKHIGRKTDWLYPCHINESIIKQSRRVVIIESLGDFLSLWDAGIKEGFVIFGTTISSKQLSYIVGLNPDKIIISTNNDEDHYKGPAAAEKIKSKLSKFFNEDKLIIKLPPKNDFGDMSKEEILDFLKGVL